MKWTIENISKLYNDLELMSEYGLPITIDVTSILKYRLDRCEITGDETSILFVNMEPFYFWIKVEPHFNKNREIYAIDCIDSTIESLIENVQFTYDEKEITNYLTF